MYINSKDDIIYIIIPYKLEEKNIFNIYDKDNIPKDVKKNNILLYKYDVKKDEITSNIENDFLY